MRINEDFFDNQDIELDILNADEEDDGNIPFDEWNRKYAHEYDQLIVLDRLFLGTEAEVTKDIKKVKRLFERLIISKLFVSLQQK